MKSVEIAPRASVLIESMRDIGYTLETALADLVDNSISAGASTVHLLASTDAARIGILDDGEGMTEAQLLEALRPGSQSPLEQRSGTDLGRFGLGLKTASFSQCRKVTVVTRQGGVTSAAQWDLDHVAKTDHWLVCIPEDPLSVPWAERLGTSGTLVVWDNLDRVSSAGSASEAQNFTRRLDEAREHLELVFHRFLSGEPGVRRMRLLLNGRPLEPLDPFHSAHPATIRGPRESIQFRGERIVVQTFTLPHHQKVTPSEWERYAGRAGYVKNQGFYVYREKRLIIHGTWFGLARQTELTKLARVRVDIPNSMDAEWKVDVRKASVQPPFQVRDRLRRIIETIGAASKRVYTSRGKRLVDNNRLPVWTRSQNKAEILYRINTDHPVLTEFCSRLPQELHTEFRRLLELAGASLPLDALFADLGGSQDQVSNAAPDEVLDHALHATYRQLAAAGIPISNIRDILQAAEPFRSNWSRTEAILNDILIQEAPSD